MVRVTTERVDLLPPDPVMFSRSPGREEQTPRHSSSEQMRSGWSPGYNSHQILGAQCCAASKVRVSGSGTFLNGNPVFTGPGRTAGSGRIQNEGNAPRKGLGNEVGGGVCRLFENSTVCLLVNANFLSLWHG